MSGDIPPRARAVVDLAALGHNYRMVARLCPAAAIVPAVKADAYGHGIEPVARTLAAQQPRPAALAVATMEEALAIVGFKLHIPVVLLGGCMDAEELKICLDAGIEPVIHSEHQAAALDAVKISGARNSRRLWIKMNTGMNRLGLPPARLSALFAWLHRHPAVEPVLMSHLACADEGPGNGHVQGQLARFASARRELTQQLKTDIPASLAASAAIMGIPDAAYQYVRPGIMLYGGSPLQGKTGLELGLRPVMSLRARLIAVNPLAAGESVGYGATYTGREAGRIGVVSIGYDDGYPRSAPNGTPVLVRVGGQLHRSRLSGRVSMDLITIDLSDFPEAKVGDEVILWGGDAQDGGVVGDSLSADEVAAAAGTISYELFCRVGRRVKFEYRE